MELRRWLGTRQRKLSQEDTDLGRDVQGQDMFWNDEETVVQYHPKKSEYKNLHPYCLHLWRKCGEDFELPPREYV